MEIQQTGFHWKEPSRCFVSSLCFYPYPIHFSLFVFLCVSLCPCNVIDLIPLCRDLSTKFAILHESVQKKVGAIGQATGHAAASPVSQGSLEDLGSEMHTVIEQQKQMMHKVEGIETLQRQ